jgi:CRP-like cAMP-binding protein
MREARLKLLQEMPIFGGMRVDILGFLLDLTRIVTKQKNEFFFRENDEADSMFVLEKGRVAVLKDWRGRDYHLAELRYGDCFGEMAVMDLGPRAGSVLALEYCSAIEISTTNLYEIYQKDLEQFTIIQMNMGREISRRLRAAQQRLFASKQEAPTVDGNRTFRST